MSLRIIGLILILWTFESEAQSKHYCELYGSVFIEENPAKADYIVYVEDSEAFADILKRKTKFLQIKKEFGFLSKMKALQSLQFLLQMTNQKPASLYSILNHRHLLVANIKCLNIIRIVLKNRF